MEENLQIETGELTEKPAKNFFDISLMDVCRGFGEIMNKVGNAGFTILIIAVWLLKYTTADQQKEITDTWILFKGETNYPPAILIFILIITLIMQQKHYKRVIALKDVRIAQLAGKKNNSYAESLMKRLSSSNKSKRS